MDKLKMATPDLTELNIEKIGKLFPNVITETKDEDGNLKKAVDFDLLKQTLSKNLLEADDERYRLDWPGKKASLLKANTPITKTLRPCREDSVNFDTTENLYIEGDNFEALKILQESYLGKVKMIYIDPPYNTGNDFIYKDDFAKSKEEYEEDLGTTDEDGGKLFRNTDSNGRFHSDWLSMMYERLVVARDLLKDDGVIFASIDDDEVDNLRKILDEIFGKDNFIAQIVRNTNSSKNQSLFVSVSHEYCLIFSKNMGKLMEVHANNKWSVPKNNVEVYVAKIKQLKAENLSDSDISEELKTLTKYPRFIDFTNYWYFDKRGLYRKDNIGGVKNGNIKPLMNPLTGKDDPVPPGGYRYNEQKLNEMISENRIHFHEDGSLPTIKRYLHENMEQRPKSIMSDDQRPDYSLMASFNTPFDNPKQLSFMTRILKVIEKDCIVLDFFSGSATTAHAVMQLNAEDGGNRKFIMVQLPEPCEESSEAFKAGYKTIAEIGKERIRRAGQKMMNDKLSIMNGKKKIVNGRKKIVNGELLMVNEKAKEQQSLFGDEVNSQFTIHNSPLETDSQLDVGFRVYKTDDTNMKDVFYHPAGLKQEELFKLESNIKEDRTPEDLLTQVILDLGLELSLPIETKKMLKNTVFIVQTNALVACFDNDIDFKIVNTIAELKPFKVVFKDASFKDDKDRINVEERFKRLSPETKVTVI